MIIKTESGNLVGRRSDRGMMLLQIESGIEYAEAVDPIGAEWTYLETTKPIPKNEPLE